MRRAWAYLGVLLGCFASCRGTSSGGPLSIGGSATTSSTFGTTTTTGSDPYIDLVTSGEDEEDEPLGCNWYALDRLDPPCTERDVIVEGNCHPGGGVRGFPAYRWTLDEIPVPSLPFLRLALRSMDPVGHDTGQGGEGGARSLDPYFDLEPQISPTDTAEVALSRFQLVGHGATILIDPAEFGAGYYLDITPDIYSSSDYRTAIAVVLDGNVILAEQRIFFQRNDVCPVEP